MNPRERYVDHQYTRLRPDAPIGREIAEATVLQR